MVCLFRNFKWPVTHIIIKVPLTDTSSRFRLDLIVSRLRQIISNFFLNFFFSSTNVHWYRVLFRVIRNGTLCFILMFRWILCCSTLSATDCGLVYNGSYFSPSFDVRYNSFFYLVVFFCVIIVFEILIICFSYFVNIELRYKSSSISFFHLYNSSCIFF